MLLTDDAGYPRVYADARVVFCGSSREELDRFGWLVLWKDGPVLTWWTPACIASNYTEQDLCNQDMYYWPYPYLSQDAVQRLARAYAEAVQTPKYQAIYKLNEQGADDVVN